MVSVRRTAFLSGYKLLSCGSAKVAYVEAIQKKHGVTAGDGWHEFCGTSVHIDFLARTSVNFSASGDRLSKSQENDLQNGRDERRQDR